MLIHEMGAPGAPGPASLSRREREVLQFVAAGLCNREIAEAMSVSTSSVKGYVSSVLRKLGVGRRAEAAVIAAREGLLPVTSDA